MDLRSIANSISSYINPNAPVTLQVSTGYTKTVGYKQVPSYTTVTGDAQIQALDNSELRQIEGMNLQGDIRGIYLRGHLHGVIRPLNLGGDLVMWDGSTWLVVKMLETWPDWSKAVIVRQQP